MREQDRKDGSTRMSLQLGEEHREGITELCHEALDAVSGGSDSQVVQPLIATPILF